MNVAMRNKLPPSVRDKEKYRAAMDSLNEYIAEMIAEGEASKVVPRELTDGERYRQFLIDEWGCSTFRLPPAEEYDKRFEKQRLDSFQEDIVENEKRVRQGLHKIYYPNQDELVFLKFQIPDDLLSSKDYEYVKKTVKEECECLKMLDDEGREAKPWSKRSLVTKCQDDSERAQYMSGRMKERMCYVPLIIFLVLALVVSFQRSHC